jgi:type IV pilus assembly protein PilC
MNLSAQIPIFNKISFLEKLFFTKHLAVMVKSGIPISEAIATISDQTPNQEFKKLLQNILKDIDNGQTLETALSRHPTVFDPLYINLIHIAEQSGNLSANLDYLAEQLRKTYEFKKKVQGALMYPMIVFIAAIVIGAGISIFVLPTLTNLFESLDVKLPLTTQILLFISRTMQNYGILIIAACIALVVGLRYAIVSPAVKPYWDLFLLSLPGFGSFFRNVQLASLTRNLGITLKSGLPITTALQTEYEAATNTVYKKYIEKIKKGVEKGKTISEILESGHFTYIPLIVNKMIAVGEKTGNLDEMLLYLNDFFEDEVDTYSKNLATILEPLVLLFIGLIVAFVALAIISPIYELTGSIHR